MEPWSWFTLPLKIRWLTSWQRAYPLRHTSSLRGPWAYAGLTEGGCWSSSVAMSARTYSFHSSAQWWTPILNSQLVPTSCIQTLVTFSFTFLLAARIPIPSLYFTLWQPHSHHTYIRAPASYLEPQSILLWLRWVSYILACTCTRRLHCLSVWHLYRLAEYSRFCYNWASNISTVPTNPFDFIIPPPLNLPL